MPGVFREIELAYDGQTYTLTPSVKMLRRVESRGVNILGTIQRLSGSEATGDVPIFDLATIACAFLQEAGVNGVDEDQVYGEFVDDLSENNGKGVQAFCRALDEAVTPVSKNRPSPAAAVEAKPRGKNKSQKSTGTAST